MATKIDRRQFLMASSAVGLAATTLVLVNAKTARVRVVGLRIESIDRPLGVESLRPRLSWRLESDDRNVRQSAYRILVASSESLIAAGSGDLWDSGKVFSRKCIGVAYEGLALTSRQRCWWNVQVWDQTGLSSVPSPTSYWEMGLLHTADWRAEWLAVEDAIAKADRQEGLHWFWGGSAKTEVPRKFRRQFTLNIPALDGVLLVGATYRLNGVWLDGNPLPIQLPSRYAVGVQPLSEINLGPLASGRHTLAVEVQSQPADELSPAEGAITAFVRLQLDNGITTRIGSERDWRTSLNQESSWYFPEYDDQAWESVHPVKSPGQPWPPAPAMYLRHTFTVGTPLKMARLYATALGAYEASLNGQRVGDALLAPESSPPSEHVSYQYQIYDVTALLHQGVNCLGLTVGDGWYASTALAFGRYAGGPPPRRVLAQLELTFADGSRQFVVTGPGWTIAPSPIQRSEIYDGEEYDARLEQLGWNTAEFDGSAWSVAEIGERPSCQLIAQVSPPIRITQTLNPVAVSEPLPGVYVFDFGQNFAGWCRMRARAPAGTRIEMRFAEALLPSGTVDQSNLRSAKQTDVFVLRGDSSEEVFEPKFTYHGFRYVQVSGLPALPAKSSIDGIVIRSDLPVTGRLRIDNPLIQQVWRNMVWTQGSDLIGIPIDCPQRDERSDQGDASLYWDAAAFNMDVQAFTHRDLKRDADLLWSSTVILPWTVWQRYADVSIIEQNWVQMNRYIHSILKNNPDGIVRIGGPTSGNGDWLAVDEKFEDDPTTPCDLVDTANWAHMVDCLNQMAQALGRNADSSSLGHLHAYIRKAFIARFVKSDGRVGNESQTSYVLALRCGLLPEELRSRAAERLVADIRRRGNALSTGFIGTQYLLDVLADAGYVRLAYDLLLRREYPSWGHMIDQGATTIWESWNGRVWTGLQNGNESMPSSYNHADLGVVCGFLFRRVAGIDAAAPGFENILVRPVLDSRLRRGGGDYESIYGLISTDWAQQDDGGFLLDATIPANTTARIHLPARQSSQVYEGRKSIDDCRDLRTVRHLDHEVVVDVGSGNYRFAVST